jgi:hypothetical protein
VDIFSLTFQIRVSLYQVSTAETQKPGRRVEPRDVELSLIERFHKVYRHNVDKRPRNIPTWCTFESGRRMPKNILDQPWLKAYEQLFVFFEPHRQIWESSLFEIRDYLGKRQPWEDYDIYVFPNDMSWCVAFTHEQMSGIEVIGTGRLPQGITDNGVESRHSTFD